MSANLPLLRKEALRETFEMEWVSIDVELNGKDLKNAQRIVGDKYTVESNRAKLFILVRKKQ
jgi:hypothetical protein